MTAIHFNLPAAQDALARSDDGAKALPGDAKLIADSEGYLQQEQLRFEDAQHAADRAAWLETACPACEPGGQGSICDRCFDRLDANAVALLGPVIYGIGAE